MTTYFWGEGYQLPLGALAPTVRLSDPPPDNYQTGEVIAKLYQQAPLLTSTNVYDPAAANLTAEITVVADLGEVQSVSAASLILGTNAGASQSGTPKAVELSSGLLLYYRHYGFANRSFAWAVDVSTDGAAWTPIGVPAVPGTLPGICSQSGEGVSFAYTKQPQTFAIGASARYVRFSLRAVTTFAELYVLAPGSPFPLLPPPPPNHEYQNPTTQAIVSVWDMAVSSGPIPPPSVCLCHPQTAWGNDCPPGTVYAGNCPPATSWDCGPA